MNSRTVTKLIIRSSNNPDWNGTFLKKDVEGEIIDILGEQTLVPSEWLYWVFDHMFFNKEFDFKLSDFIANCETLTSISFKFADGDVTIEVR